MLYECSNSSSRVEDILTESVFAQMMNSIRQYSSTRSQVVDNSDGRQQQQQQQKQCCTICLETYKVGDEIAYSYHPSCHHAFHKSCIVEWIRSDSRKNECPICRHTFISGPPAE